MVKGISRQVIVVHSPDPKLFEQAIFILKDDVVSQGITDELLLKEAHQAIRSSCSPGNRRKLSMYGPAWAAGGAVLTGLAWLMTAML